MFNLLKQFLNKRKTVKVEAKVQPADAIPVPKEDKPRHLITDRLDPANLYFGYDYRVNDKIIIHQPTIGEIVELGEAQYYSTIHYLTATPYDYMSELDDSGIDFMKISDVEFLAMMCHGIKPDAENLIFAGTLDFDKLMLFKRGDETVLYNKDLDLVVDEETLKKITECICMIHGFKKERYKPAGKIAKQMMIMVDRDEKKAKILEKKSSSSLLPILSSAINYSGFKYNLKETMDLNMYFFTDCIARIRLKDAVDGLTIGWYTGSLDTKKFKPEKQLNWMRDLRE